MAKYLDSTGLTHLVQKLKKDVIPAVKVNAAAKADTATKASTADVATKANSVDAANINGTIPISKIPQGALERVVTVADETAWLKLTTSQVQLGDTVKVTSTGRMYIVIDESKLTSKDGYMEYAAGHAATADSATNAAAVPWTGVTGKPSTFAPSSHNHTAAVKIGKADSKTVSTATKLSLSLADILGTAPTTSGSGNAITAISISGDTITATKGSTFSLSSHTHSAKIGKKDSISFGASKISLSLADILGTAPTTSGSGNAITAISISGDTITATKGTTFAVASDVNTAINGVKSRLDTLEDFTGATGSGGLADRLATAGYDIVPFSGFLTAAPTISQTSLVGDAPGLVIQGTTASDGTITVAGIYAFVQAANSSAKTYYNNWGDFLKATSDATGTPKKSVYLHKIYLDTTTGKAYYASSTSTLKQIDGGDKALTNTEIDSAITAAG